MPLSWNEIRDRALAFSREWATECSEDAEAKSFWDGFFSVFGITRRRVASFEAPVKKDDGHGGFIDLLWRGVLLVEHKSRGKDLDRAARQAFDYFPGLKERDLPRYVLVSDFARFRLYDLDNNEQHDFSLANLSKNIKLFGFIAGYQTRSFGQQDPVNIQAAEKLGKLHDLLKSSGYDGHPLEVLLVRILFCMFAEDTALFERCQFQDYLEQRTAEDGSDLGMHLAKLFQVLDTAPERRSAALDEQLAAFPYVNGQLFSETLPISDCTRQMREALLDCCALDWSRISPAIFGSLFQSIMDTTARRNLGAHYTSETNILKLIHPLFLDELWAEFRKVKRNRNQLFEFLKKLSKLTFFDPACGCGNFLVIAYRELRLLELEVLRHVRQSDQLMLDVFQLIGVNVDQFHGIEIEEWPARIAEVALWLTDHQMNLKVSEEFGQYYARLPLKKAPHIVHGNALRIDWNEVVPAYRLSYLLGNPPFVGSKLLNDTQRDEVAAVFPDVKGAGVLDYVACWYRKAADYMVENPAVSTAFVSTNSITQGEQVGILWPDLFRRGIRIHFAHRTFQWNSEARGKAAVHCVIVGFGLADVTDKLLFDYDTPQSEPHAIKANNINPYLVDGPDVVLCKRNKPLSDVAEMCKGSQPTDAGYLLMNDEEKTELVQKEPDAVGWIRSFVGAEEFINRISRWCLWLKDCPPDKLRKMPEVLKRVEGVKQTRLVSKKAATREWAQRPTLFTEDRQPVKPFLLIPSVSSERRNYIPIGFMSPECIASNLVLIIPNATSYHFGILCSAMHNAWMRSVCGRLKSDYRYSAGIVYNNFPWPEPTERQQSAIETTAQVVLDARTKFPTSTLADLYDPLTMPPELVKAHQALDRAVDAAYGKIAFKTEAERVAFLFERYQALTAPLVVGEKPAKKNAKSVLK
ncbi:MAG: methylase [Geobacteraceae bacterium GWC2_55_20]|nr:MAG: methylase [Geobacteraceae bacterium GWC2_55_20]OGU26139.1 MAG: methylase [Geobacteraceae bacterium GWF2_54_21]HCE66982.1 SAM-dependent methyltransferase [Geobacter sp.]